MVTKTDGEIFKLALPALGALLAEPMYVLTDTAIVGHLGTQQLAALALAGSVLVFATVIFNFLTYGTTAHVGRLLGESDDDAAKTVAAQALLLALLFGFVLAVVLVVAADPLVGLLGGNQRVRELAADYLRIGACGAPAVLIALVGQGYLRGQMRMRESLYILLFANALNVGLEFLFIYGFDWGLNGSAFGTLIAQLFAMAAFLRYLLPGLRLRFDGYWMRQVLISGGNIFLRTGSLLFAFLITNSVLARAGDEQLAAHQIAFELFVFLALALDALAIAGQILISRSVGEERLRRAYGVGVRVTAWSVAVGCVFTLGLLLLKGPLSAVFTTDPLVIAQLALLWPLFAVFQPIAAVAFALDGILMGFNDTAFMRNSMLAAIFLVFIPLVLLTYFEGWGVRGIWVGLAALMLARAGLMGQRFRRQRLSAVG